MLVFVYDAVTVKYWREHEKIQEDQLNNNQDLPKNYCNAGVELRSPAATVVKKRWMMLVEKE